MTIRLNNHIDTKNRLLFIAKFVMEQSSIDNISKGKPVYRLQGIYAKQFWVNRINGTNEKLWIDSMDLNSLFRPRYSLVLSAISKLLLSFRE